MTNGERIRAMTDKELAELISYIERDAIRQAFADADVKPVVRGEWIWDDEGYHCSECFFHAYGNTGEILSGAYHYCPNCGAEMRGENDENIT